MKLRLTNKAMVLWIAASAVTLAACLPLLWAWAIDASGATTVLATAGLLLAVAIAAPLPGRAARAFQRLLVALRRQDVAAMELSMAAPAIRRERDVRLAVRLLGVSAVLTAAGALVAAAVAFITPRAMASLERSFLLPRPAWDLLRLGVPLAASLPFAAAVAVAFLLGALLRGGGGKDPYATACREWLTALAVGAGVFGAAWMLGVNILGLAALAGVSLLAAGGTLLVRARIDFRPRRGSRVVERRPPVKRRLGVGATFLAFSLIAAVQARSLTDLAGVGLGGGALWLALSAAFLAERLARLDRRSRAPGDAQVAGARVGVGAAFALQIALALAGKGLGGAGQWVCFAFAAAAQAPLVALAGVAISRQRRDFASRGGRARVYLSSASFGAAAGLITFRMLFAPLSVSAGALLVFGLVGCAGLVRGVRALAPAKRVGIWTIWFASLLLAVIAADRASPLPSPTAMAPSPSASLLRVHRKGSGLLAFLGPEAFFERVGRGGLRADTVWAKAPLVDSAEAWRYSNRASIARLAAAAAPGGGLAVELSAPRADSPRALARVLAAVRSFHDVVGSGWLIAAYEGPYLDLLLLGPAEVLDKPEPREGLFVVSLESFCAEWPGAGPVRILDPIGRLDAAPDPERFRDSLYAPE